MRQRLIRTRNECALQRSAMSALYSTAILRLAVASAAYPPLSSPDARTERRAVPCGSRIILDLALDDQGRVQAIGFAITACAIGQAAAALLGTSIVGHDAATLTIAHDALARWFAQPDAPTPAWPGITALAPARAYPARHGAALLPFSAAAAAASAASARQAAA